jgi:ATP-binding cassette subfamily B protein
VTDADLSFSNLETSAADQADADLDERPGRALRAVVRLAFGVAPARTVVVALLEPASRVGQVLVAAAVGRTVDAAVTSASPIGPAVVAAGAFAAAAALGTIGLSLRRSLAEQVSHRVDLEVARLVSEIPTIDHFENPVHLDRVELLRRDPQGIGNVLNSAVLAVTNVVAAAATIVVLAAVHPALAALPLIGLSGIWANRRAERRWHALEQTTAPIARLATHLYETSTDPAAGKEIRALRIRSEIASRHQAALDEEQAQTLDAIGAEWVDAGLVAGLQSLAWVASLATVGLLAADGSVTASAIVTVAVLGSQISTVLAGTLGEARNLARMLRNAHRLLWLRTYAAEHAATAGHVPAPVRLHDGVIRR